MSKKILIIDDDTDILNLLQVNLKKYDFEVETCSEIEEFFKKVVEFKPELCLVDLNLGEYEGFGYKIVEMMRKKIGYDVVVIVMSRRNADEDIEMALECGANDYIEKPIDKQNLIAKINLFFGYTDDNGKFPYNPIPTKDGQCTFELPLQIHSISEEYLSILSHDFISKGTFIKLEGELFKCHSFTVREVTLDRQLQGYLIKLELDETEHAEIMPSIRKILLQQTFDD